MLQATSDAERERLLQLFCRLLVDLHRLDWRPFVSEPDQPHAQEAANRWVAEMRELSRSLGVSDFDEALAWLEEHASRVQTVGLSLLHWDFHPWNVLLRPDGTPAVVDWTSAAVSDARFDLAWTLLLTQASRGPALRDAVLAEYERLSGPVSDLGYFEAAACLRRIASIVISLSMGSEVFGMRAGAEEQMRRNLGHLATAYALFQERTGLRLPAAEAALA
jgi:aminoglycoside phosphotransferase (APT) family kinase protein